MTLECIYLIYTIYKHILICCEHSHCEFKYYITIIKINEFKFYSVPISGRGAAKIAKKRKSE